MFSFHDISCFQELMVLFHITRDGTEIGTVHGSYLDQENVIEFLEPHPIDLKSGDCIEDVQTGQKYYCESVRALGQNPTRAATSTWGHPKNGLAGSTTFNIGSVSGNAFIGNQRIGSVSFGASLSEIESLIRKLPRSELADGLELMDELEKIEKSDTSIPINGALGKFKNFLQKHEDLLLMIGKWAVQLMIG